MSIIISVIGAVLFCVSTKEGMVSYEDTFNVKKKKKKTLSKSEAADYCHWETVK